MARYLGPGCTGSLTRSFPATHGHSVDTHPHPPTRPYASGRKDRDQCPRPLVDSRLLRTRRTLPFPAQGSDGKEKTRNHDLGPPVGTGTVSREVSVLRSDDHRFRMSVWLFHDVLLDLFNVRHSGTGPHPRCRSVSQVCRGCQGWGEHFIKVPCVSCLL